MIKMRFALVLVILFLLAACSAEPEAVLVVPTATAPVTAVATAVPDEPDADSEPQAGTNLDQFLDELAAAVAARDFGGLSDRMSFPFALGPWRSEWSTYATSGEVQTFFDTYYAAEHTQEFQQLTVAEATQLLDGQDASGLFGPEADIAGFLHSTGWGESGGQEALLIVVEADGRYSWQGFLYTVGPFVQPELDVLAPPAGLIFRAVNDGIYQVQSDGRLVQILDEGLASAPNLHVAPDGRHAVYNDDARQLWLIDSATLEQVQVGGANLATILNWGDSSTLFVGTWLSDAESEGPNNGHLTLINIDLREAIILDEEHLSTNRPAFSLEDGRVAFEIIPAEGETLNGRIYDPETGLQPFDPAGFVITGQTLDSPVFNPAWSPDGRFLSWLQSTGERTFIQVFDLVANTAVTLHDWDPAGFGATVPSPQWSPDGQWLALEIWANGIEGSGVWLLAADSSSQTLLDAEGREPLWLNETQLVFGTNGHSLLYDIDTGQAFRLDLLEGSWVMGLAAEDAVRLAAEPDLPQVNLPDPESLNSTIEQSTSPDGRSLYFNNKTSGEGCALFVNAADLYRLDLTDGTAETVLDAGRTRTMALSPDETKLAYSFSNGQAAVLAVLDLVAGAEGSVIIMEGQALQAGAIVWSPDSSRLMLTVAHDPCGKNWTHSIVQADVSGLTAVALLEKDERRFVTQAWTDPQIVRLLDKENDGWLYLIDSGELTPEN